MTARIDRVVVPFDAGSESRTAIETAAHLATRWRAVLHGIFVEDDDLLRLAALPFTRQASLTPGDQPLETRQVEDQLRVFAERARRDVAESARRHGLDWSFEIARGSLDIATLASAENDFVVIGATTRPVGRHFRLRSRWWPSVTVAPRPILMARQAWRSGGAVLVVLRDRSEETGRLLEVAAQMAELGGFALTVIGIDDHSDAGDLTSWVEARLRDRKLRLQIEHAGAGTLQRRIVELDCRLLAFGPGAADSDDLRAVVERIDCDVLAIG